MDAGPGTDPGGLGFYLSTWMVMMAAMMFPAIAPMVLAYRDLQDRRALLRARSGQGVLSLAGYLAVWGTAGLLGYALLRAGRSLDAGFFAWNRAGRWTAAGVLAIAALYQLASSRRVVPWLLLGSDGRPVRAWIHEPHLVGAAATPSASHDMRMTQPTMTRPPP
jgi:predicted metal-binding membrane protein